MSDTDIFLPFLNQEFQLNMWVQYENYFFAMSCRFNFLMRGSNAEVLLNLPAGTIFAKCKLSYVMNVTLQCTRTNVLNCHLIRSVNQQTGYQVDFSKSSNLEISYLTLSLLSNSYAPHTT